MPRMIITIAAAAAIAAATTVAPGKHVLVVSIAGFDPLQS